MDTRWTNVYASVAEQRTIGDEEFVTFYIEVTKPNGDYWVGQYYVSKADLEDFPELFGITWDQIVETIGK